MSAYNLTVCLKAQQRKIVTKMIEILQKKRRLKKEKKISREDYKSSTQKMDGLRSIFQIKKARQNKKRKLEHFKGKIWLGIGEENRSKWNNKGNLRKYVVVIRFERAKDKKHGTSKMDCRNEALDKQIRNGSQQKRKENEIMEKTQ